MTGAEQQGPHNEVIKDVSKGPEAGSTANMTKEQFNARIDELQKQIDGLKDQRDANTRDHLAMTEKSKNGDPTDPETPADAKVLRGQISGFSAESEEVINSAKEELAKLAGEPKESTTEISADMLAAVKTAIAESYYEKYYEKQTTTPQTPETRAAWIQNYENLLRDASLESLKTQPGFAEVIDGYLKEKTPKAGEEVSAPEASEPESTPQPVAEEPGEPEELEEPEESEEAEEPGENGDIPDGTEQTPTATTPEATANTPSAVDKQGGQPVSPETPTAATPESTVNAPSAADQRGGQPVLPETPTASPNTPETPKAPERQLSLREISNRSTEIRNLLKTPIESDQKTILTSEINKLFDQSLSTGEVLTQFELIDSMNTLKQPEGTKAMLSKMENKIVADSSFLPNQKADLLSIVALKYVAAKALTEASGALDKAKTQAESAKGFILTENKNYKAALDAMKKQQNIDRFTIGNK